MKDFAQWEGFEGSRWKEQINVRDFIRHNYTPYDGDDSFLEGPTEATDKLWGKLQELQKAERANNGVLDMETKVVTGLTAYGPGYIAEDLKDLEKVVGLQTDKPLKRAFMPYGGIKMAEQACEMYGYKVDPQIHDMFTKYEFKTHNQGVFDIYTPEMKRARHSHILTGLPDTYGRGRIVGDYRRVALYGIDALIAGKEKDFADSDRQGMRRYDFQLREEIADQIRALKGMKEMAKVYGYDISEPAKNAHEAFQWLYFGYLAAIKTQNGAAMSVGRISTFLDIYIERDLKNGVITEKEAQELVDHMVMKFRMVKFARIESYNQLFSGDPVWQLLRLQVLVLTDATWLPRMTIVSFILLRIWDRLRSQTLLFFILPSCRKTSRNMLLIFLLQQVLSSMRTMMLCVRYGAMIIPSAAVYLQLRPVRKCSSLELVQTLRNASFMRSTVVWMRS